MDAVVEPLECRRLLSAAPAVANVDLAGRIVAQPLNELFVTPRAGAHASAAVQVVNVGAVPAVGSLSIALQISPGPVFVSGLPVVGRQMISRVKLPAGGSRVFNISFKVPAGVPAGGYHLFGLISGSHGIVESNLRNNIAGSIAPIAVTNRPIGAQRQVHDQSSWCDTSDSGFDATDEALLAGSSAVLGGSVLESTATDQSGGGDAASQPATQPSTQPADTSGDISDTNSDSSSDDSSSG